MKNNISFRVIGDIEKLPANVQQRLNTCVAHTSHNTGMCLVLALSYSSRWEITEAARQIADLRQRTLSMHYPRIRRAVPRNDVVGNIGPKVAESRSKLAETQQELALSTTDVEHSALTAKQLQIGSDQLQARPIPKSLRAAPCRSPAVPDLVELGRIVHLFEILFRPQDHFGGGLS